MKTTGAMIGARMHEPSQRFMLVRRRCYQLINVNVHRKRENGTWGGIARVKIIVNFKWTRVGVNVKPTTVSASDR